MTRPPAGLWPRRAVLGAALVLTTSACGGSDGAPSDDRGGAGGVRGVTDVDVGCAPSAGTTTCPREPLRARLRFVRQDRRAPEVEVRTGEDGTFAVELPRGRYEVVPENLAAAPYPRADRLTVEVHEGEFTTITVTFDSGVR